MGENMYQYKKEVNLNYLEAIKKVKSELEKEGFGVITEINVKEYEASSGKEYFISAEMEDTLLGFCRMRFPSHCLREEITAQSALIRELHVYGVAVPIGKEGNIQHQGIGKKLLATAEGIAAKAGKDKIVVISGVGVRKYYEKSGFRLEGPYMVKSSGSA